MKALVAFYGNGRGAGKNTAAEYVKLWCQAHDISYDEKAFALVGKEVIAKALGMNSVEEVDDFKLDGRISAEKRMWNDEADDTIWTDLAPHLSGRQFIINLLEAFREKWGPYFWTEFLFGDPWEPEAEVTVITDLRFDPEAERVRNLGGVVVEIHRDVAIPGQSENALTGSHVSKVIYNDGTHDDLREEIFRFMRQLPKD